MDKQGLRYTGKYISPRELTHLRNVFKKNRRESWNLLMSGLAPYLHELALEAGCDEIPGYYGLDMDTGMFVSREIDRDPPQQAFKYPQPGRDNPA